MSNPLSALAASLTNLTRTFTPSDIFEEWKIGIIEEASFIFPNSSSLNPVVAITRGVFVLVA